MAELQTSTWSETAASNNAATPDGWPEGQTFASVNNCAREMMAAIKRGWNRDHPTLIAGGTANALTLTYTTAPPAYVSGMTFAFWAGAADNTTTNPTINVNALGAKTIYRLNGATALAAGDIIANSLHEVTYDGTNMRLSLTAGSSTKAASGRTVLPNGVIMMWGIGTYTAGFGSVLYTGVGLPVFPTATRVVMLTLDASTTHASFPPAVNPASYSTLGFTVYGGAGQAGGFRWLAIGD